MATPLKIFEAKASISILELTPTNKELKEPWLICSLSFIRGDDVPFTQAVKPGENVDEAPILNEESIEIDDKSEVIDGTPDLVGGVDELKTKLVQTLTYNVSPQETEVGNTSRLTPFDDSMKLNDFKDGKYCLDDMSIGFEEDTSNGEIKIVSNKLGL
ncbi:hypothetical protein Tco_1144020 [Tanacetum coccineum]